MYGLPKSGSFNLVGPKEGQKVQPGWEWSGARMVGLVKREDAANWVCSLNEKVLSHKQTGAEKQEAQVAV